jgi:GSH-dependent disulfide-bond oxidoreductase
MPRPSRTRAVKSAKSLTPKLATPKRVKSNGAKLTRAKLTRAKPTRAKPRRTEPTRASRSKLPIELYYWPTPNGWKISIMLEECGLPYVVRPVDISKGEQFSPEFLAISPNNRMPAIVDPNGPAGRPISVFESGAILQYLGRKTGQFYPREERARVAVDEWLFWQMGGLGPMAGQANHFRLYASEQIAYAIDRYTNEVNRLFGVMDTRLAAREFLAGRYSVADMACVGWVRLAERMGQELAQFPHLKRWFETVRARPAVKRAFAIRVEAASAVDMKDPKVRAILFGQTAR